MELKEYKRKGEKSGDTNILQQIYFHKPTLAQIRLYSPINPFSSHSVINLFILSILLKEFLQRNKKPKVSNGKLFILKKEKKPQ